ncbi:MAG: PepSY domain-containing protein [Bacillaceae bacterium]
MSWKKTIVSLGAGFAAGYLLQKKREDNRFVSGSDALKNAKEIFKKKSEVVGSWIYMVPEKVERFQIGYDVYRAGINTIVDGEAKNYELLLDAKTGTILEAVEK